MNKTAKNSAIYLAGTMISAVFGLVNTMLLTRVLDETVYGMYGLLTNFITAATTFIAFGYDSAYSRFYYRHGFTQQHFIRYTLRTPMLVFALFALLLLEPNQYLLTYVFGNRLDYATVVLLLVYALFAFVHRFTQLTARMEERAFNYVGSNFVGKFGFVAIVLLVYIVARSVSFNWVVLSFLISGVVATAMNLFIFTRLSRQRNVASELVTEKDLFSYGFPYMLNNVLILIVPLVEKIIIRESAGGGATGDRMLAVYTAAAVFQTVILLITNTIINIWNPLVYKHFDNEKRFKPILHLFGLTATVVLVVGLAFCILLRPVLVLILDARYRADVSVIAPAILFGACFNVLNIIYSVGINIKKKTGYFIVSPLIQLVISVALCFVLVPGMGLIGVAIASLASLVISKTYRILVGMHFYNTGVSEWKSVALCVIGVAASVFALFFNTWISNALVFAGLIGAVLVIVNKEIVSLVQSMKEILRGRGKKQEQEGELTE
ncbi:MAG: lipopolysaccharide biosynthesis protein [Clostridia bacterium]|nr:lipopolysaccharide biosynthesis protein [Clostridia bacterium]